MPDGVITAYQNPPINSDEEVGRLDRAVVRRLLRFLQRIVSRQIDHWTLQAFCEHHDVPVYKADYHDCFVLFAVEDGLDDDIAVTIMGAFRRAQATIDGGSWNGNDMALIHDILHRRLEGMLG